MHAVKVGWGGQTFALAKCSDSGGKKSRIRRSKEERKSMVESFIKKYQKSNNGSFPSLNLTHKEVGGSFYTVREIVREIIQENRVLGPAKWTVDEQSTDQNFEHYPLGSISTSPSSQLSLSLDANSNGFITIEPQTITEEVLTTSNGELPRSEQHLVDNVGNINGILVDKQYEETHTSNSSSPTKDEMLHTDVKTLHEGMQNSFKASPSAFTSLETDIVVETFPLRSVAILTHDTEGKAGELGNLTGNSDVQGTEVKAAPELESSGYLDRMNSVEKHSTGSLDEKSTSNLADPLFESSSSSSIRNDRTDTLDGSGLQVDILHKDDITLGAADQTQGSVGIQPKPIADELCTKSTDADNADINCGESVSQEAVTIEAKADSSSIDEGRSSTLNRAKLKSWEGVSKRPAREEENPILAVFKAFVSAFVKFWTE